MIITQTPLRVGLVGGGTDLPDYYREHGGRVLNAAIDKYVYVVVKQRFDDDIYVNYSTKEIVSRVEDLNHELVREALHMTGIRGGVEITTLADIPSAGSGLGSSSAVTVGSAAGALRLPGAAAHGRGAGRPGLRDRDRPLPQADRQAGPVRRRVRGRLRHPLRTGRPRGRRPARADTRAAPADPGRAAALLHRDHAQGGLASWASRPRTSATVCRSWDCCGTSPARRPTGCASAMSTRSASR